MTEERRIQKRPIGYWLKRADALLTARIDEAQRENGLTRLEWQILNVIHDARVVHSERVVESLRPFASAFDVIGTLDSLAERSVVASADDAFSLTEAGEEMYERALAVQQDIRRQAFEGISEGEYDTTMRALERLVANLERR